MRKIVRIFIIVLFSLLMLTRCSLQKHSGSVLKNDIRNEGKLKYNLIYHKQTSHNADTIDVLIVDFLSGFDKDKICLKFDHVEVCDTITTDRSIDFAKQYKLSVKKNMQLNFIYQDYSSIPLNLESNYKYVRIWYDIFKNKIIIEYSNEELEIY